MNGGGARVGDARTALPHSRPIVISTDDKGASSGRGGVERSRQSLQCHADAGRSPQGLANKIGLSGSQRALAGLGPEMTCR
jgi:hypothetical protein